MAIVRDQELLDIMNKPRDLDASAPDALDDDRSVSTIYVPTETPPYLVAAADYAFDRTLMRGLWVWGRHLAIQRVLGQSPLRGSMKLYERLGWADLEPNASVLAAQDAQTMQPWLDAFSIPTECAAHQQARQSAGQNRIRTCVPDCKPVTADGKGFPQYLVCPANGSVPAFERRGRADAGAPRPAERREP